MIRSGGRQNDPEVTTPYERPKRDAWLLAPSNTVARPTKWMLLGALGLMVFCWCLLREGALHLADDLPDVRFYVDTALGQYGSVPQPFSSRPLAPLLARSVAALSHGSVQQGFVLVDWALLLWTVFAVLWLISRSGAPRWYLLAVAAVPFWPWLRLWAGLPDPLYAALIAALLIALETGSLYPAAALMFPLMLARESTWLTLVCFLAIAWRPLKWAGCLLAIASSATAALIVRRFSLEGLPNPEHLSGGFYMLGKLASNLFRSFGLLPWSNVYPVLCKVPAWQFQTHLGPFRSLGVCTWTWIAPLQLLGALLTTFGVLPWLVLLFSRQWRAKLAERDLVLGFCLLYGGLSAVLAPALGTWYTRLLAYAWPLFLVGVPRLATQPVVHQPQWTHEGVYPWIGLLVLQMLICFEGTRPPSPSNFAEVALTQFAAGALVLMQLRRARIVRTGAER